MPRKKPLSCAICGLEMWKYEAITCASCGKVLCAKHAFSYVDGNNKAITDNSPILCKECYIKKYGYGW